MKNTVTRRPKNILPLSTAGTVILLGLIFVPNFAQFSIQLKIVNLLILILIAGMWNVLAGFGGVVSFGQQAYIGIGAYTFIFCADTLKLNVLVSLVLAGIFSIVIAYPLSFIIFRLKGGYFAIGTWVIAEIIKLFVQQIEILGGGSGLSLAAFSSMDRENRIHFVYWTTLSIFLIVFLASFILMRSKLGLALGAIRDDAEAAGVMGVSVDFSRRLIYSVASIGFGIAGGLIAMTNLRIQPEDIFSINYSATMLFIVIIGGIGTFEGPVIGSIFYYILLDQLRDYGSWYIIILGIVGIFIVTKFSGGIWGVISRGKFNLFAFRYYVKQEEKG